MHLNLKTENILIYLKINKRFVYNNKYLCLSFSHVLGMATAIWLLATR